MDLQIVERTGFWVLGVQVHFEDIHAADFGGLWEKGFGPHAREIEALSVDGKYYGVGFCSADGKGVEYMAAMAVPAGVAVAEGLTLRECPAATDAVIACTMKTIGDAYHYIYGEWLPGSDYECGEPLPWYECYPGDSDGSPDSPVEVHVAVKRKGK